MIKTSAAYKEAVRADVRRTRLKVEAVLESPEREYAEAGYSTIMDFSGVSALNDGMETIGAYATIEPSRWVLDGTFDVLPDEGVVTDAGFVFSALSGADGTFDTPQVLRREFSGVVILRALTVWFSDIAADGVADSFTVTVYQDEDVAFTKTFTGNTDAQVVVSGINAARPTAVEISITKWSLPYRRARMAELMLGRKEVWTEDDLTGFAVKHQTDVSCMSLPYGTCDITISDEAGLFDTRNAYGLFDTIEDRQRISVSIGVDTDGGTEYVPLGTFYQYNGGWKTGTFSRLVSWTLVDIIGLLADREFSVSWHDAPSTLAGWTAAVVAHLGDAFAGKYYVDPDYADLPLYVDGGGLFSTCADVLRQICLVTGTFPRADAKTGKLCIEPLSNVGGEEGLSDILEYPTFAANDEIASVTVGWIDSRDREQTYTLQGNSDAAAKEITLFIPFIHDAQTARIVAERIASAYGGTKYELRGRGDPSREIGDVDTVTLEGGAIVGRRIYQDFSYEGGVLQKCKSTLLRANGLFLFTKRVEFTEDGSFTVPDGVTELRIILVGGGEGGSYGRQIERIYGEGGYVYVTDVAVSAGDVFSVIIGAGGAAGESQGVAGGDTRLGTYTSRAGRRYSPAYTDLPSGKSYAMRGVPGNPPPEGTGNGGNGFLAGASGAAIIYYREAENA